MHDVNSPGTSTCLFLPPYDRFTAIKDVTSCPQRGVAVIWRIADAKTQEVERDWLQARPPCVSLIIMLPPPSAIRSALPLVREASTLRPRGVLPNSGVNSPEPVRLLLSSAPRDLPTLCTGHLAERKLLRNQVVRALVKRIFEMSATIPSISKLCRKLYTSRRTVGRLFEAQGLPVPSHWLQLGRLMHVSAMIQEKQTMPIARAAVHLSYPDGFTMSNQMKRLLGCRPSEVRECLGLAWILEDWIYREKISGRMCCDDEYSGYDNVDNWLRSGPMQRNT